MFGQTVGPHSLLKLHKINYYIAVMNYYRFHGLKQCKLSTLQSGGQKSKIVLTGLRPRSWLYESFRRKSICLFFFFFSSFYKLSIVLGSWPQSSIFKAKFLFCHFHNSLIYLHLLFIRVLMITLALPG